MENTNKNNSPVISKAQRDDFIELEYTGYSNGNIFDSNIEEDLKTLDSKAKVEKTIIVVGQKMVVPGLDKDLEEKEIGKEYRVELKAKDAFGERNRDLVKTIPLKIFREKSMNPQPGMVFAMDNTLAKIIAVSGARVVADFNNPLSGKDVSYKFKIVRKIDSDKEKSEALFSRFLRFIPEFEIKDNIIVKGPETMKMFIDSLNDKFKELIGKELKFEIKEKKKELNKKEENKETLDSEKSD